MKLTSPCVYILWGLILLNIEFTQLVDQCLIQQQETMSTSCLSGLGLGALGALPHSLLLCVWRLFHHWLRGVKIFSLANYKSRSMVFKNLRFCRISLSLFMKIQIRNDLYLGKSPCPLCLTQKAWEVIDPYGGFLPQP